MTTLRPRWFLAMVLSMAAASCIGENRITEGEAEEGWRVVAEPLQQGQQTMQQKVDEMDPLELISRDEPVTVRSECDDGGDARFELRVSANTDAGASRDLNIDFGVDFRDCQDLESTATGHLDIILPPGFGRPSGGGGAGSVDAGANADAGSSESNAIGYEGAIDFVGDVDGPCKVDMEAVTDTSTGQPSYSGDWCGYDASETVGSPFGF